MARRSILHMAAPAPAAASIAERALPTSASRTRPNSKQARAADRCGRNALASSSSLRVPRTASMRSQRGGRAALDQSIPELDLVNNRCGPAVGHVSCSHGRKHRRRKGRRCSNRTTPWDRRVQLRASDSQTLFAYRPNRSSRRVMPWPPSAPDSVAIHGSCRPS